MTEGSWKPSSKLLKTRYAAASILSPGNGWMISGGFEYSYDYYSPMDSVETVSNGQFVNGESLPIAVAGHCLVNMDDNHMMLVGGYRVVDWNGVATSYDSWIYTVD